MKLAEIRQQGYKALTEALGVVGTLRFIQQFEAGYGNYTQERHQKPNPTLEEFQNFINQNSN
jgi:hypothetical protein